MPDPHSLINIALQTEPGWDGHDGKPTSEEAIACLAGLNILPISNGGILIEFHAAGLDVEIEIPPNGRNGYGSVRTVEIDDDQT